MGARLLPPLPPFPPLCPLHICSDRCGGSRSPPSFFPLRPLHFGADRCCGGVQGAAACAAVGAVLGAAPRGCQPCASQRPGSRLHALAPASPGRAGGQVLSDVPKKGKCIVLKTSTRQTVFLPVPGLVDPDSLRPGDLVGVNKDSYLILDTLPAEYDSR